MAQSAVDHVAHALQTALHHLDGAALGQLRPAQALECQLHRSQRVAELVRDEPQVLRALPLKLERGSEWFIITKNHRDGTVRFSISALWEPGQFPNRWSRLGFKLLARRYQRAWHRRAFRRLRDRLIPDAAGTHAFHAVTRPSWTTAARIGAVAGLRSMLAPALVSRALENAGAAGHGLAGRALASPAAGAILPVVAALELLADKLPMISARIAPHIASLHHLHRWSPGCPGLA